MPEEKPISIKELYPDFNDDQLKEAEANLRHFARVLMEIHRDKPDLTVSGTLHNIDAERSNPTNQPS